MIFVYLSSTSANSNIQTMGIIISELIIIILYIFAFSSFPSVFTFSRTLNEKSESLWIVLLRKGKEERILV